MRHAAAQQIFLQPRDHHSMVLGGALPVRPYATILFYGKGVKVPISIILYIRHLLFNLRNTNSVSWLLKCDLPLYLGCAS